jgi:CheY-like chemotaxis protein
LWGQLETLQPDVLLLDWELPGLNPADAVSRLRAILPQLTVIALSGRLEARQTALAAGADAFVSKSKPPSQLLAVLRAISQQIENSREIK